VGEDGRPASTLAIADDEVPTLEAAIDRYLDVTGQRPRAAVLGIAGPIQGDMIALTNRPWRFRLSELATRFNFSAVRAVNDFEAVAWSLRRLAPSDLRPIGEAGPSGNGAKVVFGPGTGLGVAALAPCQTGWTVIVSEGGHASFGPAGEEEEQVFSKLRREFGPISVETILSGPGLERLHRALHGPGEPLTAEAIARCAVRVEEPACATVKLFTRLLGRFAGDVALMFKATGGVYVAGGVAQRIAPLLNATVFRTAFEAHPPYGRLLESIPTQLITLEQPGLLGCAVVAAELDGSAAAR
jgi:glucokinase